MSENRRKHELRNYDFCFGGGLNWYDMERGRFYHIQEYKEALDNGEHPKGIRVTTDGNPEHTVEWVNEYILQERMKDPEPDPRF